MIYAGAVGSVGFWEDLVTYTSAAAPGFEEELLWILVILQNIASLGGVAVIIGGYLVTTNRVGTGKVIIGIAAGMGIFGFIMLIYNMYNAMGIAAFTVLLNLLATSASILGPVITVVARIRVKKPE